MSKHCDLFCPVSGAFFPRHQVLWPATAIMPLRIALRVLSVLRRPPRTASLTAAHRVTLRFFTALPQKRSPSHLYCDASVITQSSSRARRRGVKHNLRCIVSCVDAGRLSLQTELSRSSSATLLRLRSLSVSAVSCCKSRTSCKYVLSAFRAVTCRLGCSLL